MANEASVDRELIDLFLRKSPRSKRPRPIAAPMPAIEKRPRAAEPLSKVVVPVTVLTPAVVVLVWRSNGTVAKTGAERAKATMIALYIMIVNLIRN